jgi:trk system potassium uptake protein TrkH
MPLSVAISPRFLRVAVILRITGLLFMMFSLSMLPPVGVAWWYGDGEGKVFIETFFLILGIGLLAWFPVRQVRHDLNSRDGFAVVLLFWTLLPVLGAVPFELSGRPHMHVADAVFEAASGLTTTGATVLSGLDQLPHAIKYYRAQLNFLGGMGIVVLAVALLPMLGIGGMQLYLAETPGPMKERKIAPRINETARSLWAVYVGLNVACTIAFWNAGMDLFDAICHSFATLALGGFSTHDTSIGHFQSPAIEGVAGIFSLVAGVNFALHFFAWRTNSLNVYIQDPEFRTYAYFMGGVIVLTCGYLYLSGEFPLWPAIYHGFFQAASITTDNGLVTVGYPADWPAFVPALLIVASFFGGSAGSTCGGIKALRFMVMFKQGVRELKLLLHPNAQIALKVGRYTLPERVVQAVWALFFIYISTYGVLSLVLMAMGIDAVTAFGSVAGCMNNMGVGLGQTASNFGGLSDAAKWVLSLSMLLGRFEVMPLLLLFTRDFWNK